MLPYVKRISTESKNFDIVAAPLSLVPCLLLNFPQQVLRPKKLGKQVPMRDWMLSSSETVIMGTQTIVHS